MLLRAWRPRAVSFVDVAAAARKFLMPRSVYYVSGAYVPRNAPPSLGQSLKTSVLQTASAAGGVEERPL